MQWMKANLSSNAIILVNTNDAGLFIPTVSHQKIIFPWTASSSSLSYETLANLTLDRTLNATTYELMQKYNITDIYVGSAATGFWTQDFRWDPYLFLGNPNFKLLAKFGSSYLFQINSNPSLENIAFLGNIENGNLSSDGWSPGYIGNGVGNVTSTIDLLNITAQAVYTDSQIGYATYVSREIFVPNDSDVSLSFYLSAADGFNGKDTFAAIISNVYGNQSYIITTPNGTYENYHNLLTLPNLQGMFTFEGNNSLTAVWRQAFNSPLPSSFNLEFINWDFDGVPNVAYLGDVNVTATPAH
jgi:hypothetical protein